MPKINREFASMSEFVEYVQKPRLPGAASQSTDNGEEFTGTVDWDDAMGKVFRWDEGAAQVDAMRSAINLGIEKFRSETYRSATLPGAVSMPDYIAGHPKPVVARRRTTEKHKGAGKVVRLVINPSASGAIDKAVLMRRGAAVMALAEAIEKRGGRVEIVARSGVKSGHTSTAMEVLIKSAGTRLNLHSVAFALAHPSMLRRLYFKAWEVTPGLESLTRACYGMPWNPPVNEGEVYLPAMTYGEPQWESTDAAIAWVNNYLRDNGWIK